MLCYIKEFLLLNSLVISAMLTVMAFLQWLWWCPLSIANCIVKYSNKHAQQNVTSMTLFNMKKKQIALCNFYFCFSPWIGGSSKFFLCSFQVISAMVKYFEIEFKILGECVADNNRSYDSWGSRLESCGWISHVQVSYNRL